MGLHGNGFQTPVFAAGDEPVIPPKQGRKRREFEESARNWLNGGDRLELPSRRTESGASKMMAIPRNQNHQDLFLEYFSARDLLHYSRNMFPLPFMMKDKPDEKLRSSLLTSMLERAKSLNIDHKEFEKRLAARVRDLAKWEPEALEVPGRTGTGTEPKKSPRRSRLDKYLVKDRVSDLLSAHVDSLQKKLREITRSKDKAVTGLKALIESGVDLDEVMDALVFFGDEMSAYVTAEVELWKRERESTRDDFRFRNIFWASPSREFVTDGVSHYRLRERFEIGGFESAFETFEKEVSGGLFETHVGGDVRRIANDLCSISRSRQLTTRIRPAIDVALEHIASKQKAEFWSEPWRHRNVDQDMPSIGTTIPAALSLLKLSSSDSTRTKAITAVKWLMEQQDADGGWSIEYVRNGKLAKGPDLLSTLLAMEAIGRSQLSGSDHSLQSARNWVLEQQNVIGFWEVDGMGPASATTLVLETFRYLDLTRPHADDVYLVASAGYLKRSILLSLEDSSTSYRLAVLAAHLGIESLLYSILEEKNISIWDRQDKNQTIGMRAALTAVQGWLQQAKLLKPNEIVHRRNSIERLAHLRDEVVHKAAEITVGECRKLIGDCAHFATEYSLEIYGYDYLD